MYVVNLVVSPQKSYIEILSPNVTVVGDRVLTEVIKVK